MSLWRRLGRSAVLGGALCLIAASSAFASLAHPRVVQENPVNVTPHASNGAVNKFAQIGSTMFAGGTFTQVQNSARTVTHNRQRLFSFNASTGAITSFAPNVGGTVWALEPSSDGTGLYVGGSFSSVNGVSARSVFKWDLVNNRVDPTFKPTVTGGRVVDLQLISGRLFVSGSFAKRLVALNPTTGADTGYLNLNVAGVTGTPGDGWAGEVYRFSVNPARTRMVIIGNFSSVSGQQRRQIAMINLGTTATLSSWYSSRWNLTCASSLPWYTRDVDWSPDGSYFVVVTTGAGFPGTTKLCDTATKWADSTNSNAAPVWINYTGGDTLYSVAATGVAVYVGGHQRWLDNPQGRDFKGPGAVDRPGIGAIDPNTGKALAWNPTRTRGQGAKDLYVTSAGLWVGSDTDVFFNEYHGRIAFCPL
jgi:hypothetical protein